MLVATWVGMGVVITLSVIGWLLAYNRYSRNEAMHIGELKGLVMGLGARMESIEKRMGSFEERLNSLIGRGG